MVCYHMGCSISAGILVKIVNKILKPFTNMCVIAYLDDIMLMSTDEEHLNDLNLILKAFEEANLLIHPGKCSFGKNEMEFLGYKFTPDSIQPSDKHVKAVQTYYTPKSTKDVRV